MSTDVQRAVQFLNPVTGEVLNLDAPDQDLARYLADIREFESVLKEHKRMVGRELLSRLDFARKWTRHVEGGWKLSAPSPKPVEEWDGATLREALLAYVDAGALSVEAVDAAVEATVSYRVKKSGVNALRAGGGEIAETVDALATSAEKERYVKVERA